MIYDYSEFHRDADNRDFKEKNKRYLTLSYDVVTDKEIMKQIHNILMSQPLCTNCINYQYIGNFCGYEAHDCKIHGDIEYFGHPHHDLDGSKCEDYERKADVSE